MAILIGGVLALFSIAVLLYPFLKGRGTGEIPAGNQDEPPQDLEPVYQAIRTLQLEHQLGRIPDDSYQELLDVYRMEAAEILRSRALTRDDGRDPKHSGESEEAALEQEILLARTRISGESAPQPSNDPETQAK